MRFVADLSAGMVVGLLTVAVSTSLAVLIYSGELSDFAARGIGLSLIGTLLIGLTVALTSSLPGMVASIQDAPAAVLAVTAAAIAGAAASTIAPEAAFATVVATMMAATLAAAAAMLVAGYVRLGKLVHYLPYPVIGGFLAGTGWLLFTGGLGVMMELPPGRVLSGMLWAPGMPVRWLPGVALAVALLLITSRSRHILIWPGVLTGATALFYLVMAASGGSFEAWRAQGLLLGPFPAGERLGLFDYRDLGLVRWDLVARNAAGAVTAVFIGLMSVPLNSVGIELATGRKIDLNQELRSAGFGNVLAGLAGGTIGYPVLGFTTLNHRAGSGNRVSSLVGVGVVAATLLLGTRVLAYIPTMLVAGLLVYLGLSFLIEWVYRALFRLPRLEYAVVLLILLVIATTGFLQGVAVGLVAAVILFTISYSRNNVVRGVFTGAALQSRVNRPPWQREQLQGKGAQLLILQLQGYIFFGTAHTLLERIERQMRSTHELRVLVLDFKEVTGLDATALLRFEALAQLAQQQGITVVLTQLLAPVARQVESSGVFRRHGNMQTLPTLDAGLEWAEEQFLAEASGPAPPADLAGQLAALQGESRGVDELMAYLERCALSAGDRLIDQGALADDLYFLERGQVTAQLERAGEPPLRLETMRGGTVVGELAFFGLGVRQASVVVDEPSVLHRLTRASLRELELRSPDGTACFYRIASRLLSERAVHLLGVVAGLQR